MLGILGNITNPTAYASSNGEGLFNFISNIFKLAGVIAGIVLIFRIITAGYAYLSAMGDAKKVQAAGDTITQSVLGLVVVAAAFIIASLVARFTGINILNPTIYGP